MLSNPNLWTDDEYNTGLTLDHTTVAHFIPAIKPESKEAKIAFINNFERRGGWYYPGRGGAGDTYSLNVKLHGAVSIPDEFLAVTDTEWFYQDWHDHDVAHLEAEFVVKHKGYSTCFAGRSGGHFLLQYAEGNIDEPEVDEESETYEKVYERYNHYQAWWKRFIKLHLHDGHKRRLEQIVREIEVKWGLVYNHVHPYTVYDKVQNAARMRWFYSSKRGQIYNSGGVLFERFFKTDGVYYDNIPTITHELAEALSQEIEDYKKKWEELRLVAREMYQKKYGKDSTNEPDALLTWEDEDLDDLFNVLWGFLVLAQSLAISFAYKCFWDTVHAKSEEVVDTEEEIS